MSDGWYYLGAQGHIGPLGLQELKRTLAGFRNGKDVLVWREGFSGWERAGDVPELRPRTSLPPSPTDGRRNGTAKLPLWKTIRLSYSSYFLNFTDVLRISWLWLAVVAPLMGIMSWLQFSLMADVIASMKRGMPTQMPTSKPLETMVPVTIAILFFAFAGVSIAVAWHRRIILGEHPGFSGSNVATKGLWRYVWMGFAIFLIVFLPIMVILLSVSLLLSPVAKAGTSWSLILIPVIFLLWLAGVAVALRLHLLLPARAVGDLDLTFKETWKRTSGNTWRIFWGIVACAIPPVALQLPVQIVSSSFLVLRHGTSDGNAIVGVAAISGILFASNLLTLPIGIGFISYAYSHFFGRR
jgi:GYF domain 2